MKINHLNFIVLLLGMNLLSIPAAFSQTPNPPLANNVQDDNRMNSEPFAEERMAAQAFIENVNEARRELAMRQVELARQKIIMARNLIPLIARVAPQQRRLTRVEFGGGLYADDLEQRKSYAPIETQSLEDLTRSGGARWTKSTRQESDAKIIYVTLDLTDGKAQDYLDQAEKDIVAGKLKEAEAQLAELSDSVIRIDDTVPAAVQARDYIILAENYIKASNFFGARYSLERSNDFLGKMKNEDIYKPYHPDIIALHKSISDLQEAFARLDSDQIKTAEISLKKWQQQLSLWADETLKNGL
jgi:hypothetical protein